MYRWWAERRGGSRHVWRRAAVIALSYVFVIQSLLIGVVGSQIAANPDIGSGGYVLCLGAGEGGQHAPSHAPDRHTLGHCIFCFAAAHDAALALAQSGGALWIAGNGQRHVSPTGWQLPHFAHYTSARPRGPPISA